MIQIAPGLLRVAQLAMLVFGISGAAVAVAAEYREVVGPYAILYDGPSDKATKQFVLPTGAPVQVLSSLPAWTKIRDVEGSILWVRNDALGPVGHLIALRSLSVRAGPSESAAPSYSVARGVLLERAGTGPAAGWYEIRHEGDRGYVRASDVWGN